MEKQHMNKNSIIGHGGSGDVPAPYVPVEDANTLQANTYANIVDLLAEGEIGGPAIDNNWYKSTYLNEIPIQNPSTLTESYNYTGITIVGNNGTENQDFLPGFSPIESEVTVDTAVTILSGPISRTITDSNVNNVKVTIQIPALLSQETNGDKKEAQVQLTISVTPDNGAGTKQKVISEEEGGKIFGKCISEYRKQLEIRDLQQYGSAPWVITVERITPDSGSLNLINAFKWYSYTTQIDTKLRYYDRAVVGLTINSKQFGNTLPTRAYRVNGRKIKVPSNYDADTRTYSGDWDGTFTLASSNNPAWIIYDILTSTSILGDVISEDMVDKWGLYTCGQYCDQTVSYSTRTINTSGSHTSDTGTEHRFSFNSVIETRTQALNVVTHLCSVMNTYPIWTSGMLKFIQDKPITTPARPVGLSNVSPDGFEYQGTPKRNKHTVVRVSWNNPDTFGKLDTLELVDEQGIRDFGYNEIDFAAFGCTSRTEAIRRGRYVLDTDINTGEIVSFAGSTEFADCLPGDLLSIQDEHYAGVSLEGRVKSSTTTSLVLDRALTFTSGNTYTALIQQPNGAAVERQLTNSAGTTATLTWATALPVAAQYESFLVVTSTNIATRKFVVTSVSEVDNYFNIVAVEYDPNKYSRIETGVVGEIPVPNTSVVSSVLLPPTNIVVEGFTYTEGDQGIRKFGIQIGWTHSTDPRVDSYELRYREITTGWKTLGETRENNFDWKDTTGAMYDIGVRAKGVGMVSEWLSYLAFTMNTDLTDLAAPTNLRTLDGNDEWTGADCTILWDESVGSQYGDASVGKSNIGYYKVEVRKPDTTLIRTFNTASKYDTTYTYTFQDNVNDNVTPLRQLLFMVYTVDVFDDPSTGYDSMSASNPAPDLSSVTPTLTAKYGYIKASWGIATDKDISYYKVYFDDVNPPTEVHSIVQHPTNTLDVNGLLADTDYFCQIEPYDLFGAGTKSQVSGAENIYQIPSVNVDIELSESITRTDSDNNTTATLEKLYNGLLSTDGVSYTVAGTDKYIQYQYGVENYFDRIGIWTNNANGRVYIGYSLDGTTWNYLKAEADHTIDSSEKLIVASSQADARTNYLQLTTGKNYALFPNNITAEYIRLYITGSYTTTIYEFIPSRILISELAAIGHLSAYSSDIGTMISGRLQNTANTTYFDLDDNRLKLGDKFDFNNGTLAVTGSITVSTGSTGYTNLSDKPSTLNTINSTEYTNLTTATSNASTAISLLNDISSDDKLTALEKQSTKVEYDAIVGEKSDINSLATTLSITTENTNYNTYYTTLTNYLSPLLSDLTTTSTIVGTTFRTNFTNFYNYRQILFNKINSVINTTATTASSTATTANTNANTAISTMNDMANDNKLTASEKQSTKVEYDAILGEKSGINSLAAQLGIVTENTNYNTYYTTLTNYLSPLLASLTTTSDIVGTTFRTNFTNFYNYRQTLLNKIASVTGGIKFTTTPVTPYRVGDLWQNGTSVYRCTVERLTGSYTAADWTISSTNETGIYVPGTTQINGGQIHASSNITIGNTVNGAYSVMGAGDIVFYNYFTGIGHQAVKSLKKVEVGICTNGIQTTLPGYWKTQPKIMVSPNNIQTYNRAYSNYDQTLTCQQPTASQISTGVWAFTPIAALSLSNGTISGVLSTSYDYYPTKSGETLSTAIGTGPQVALPAGVRSLNVTINKFGWVFYLDPGISNEIWSANAQFNLQYYMNGAWRDTVWSNQVVSTTWNTFTASISTQLYDITYIRVQQRSTYTTVSQAKVGFLYSAYDDRMRIQSIITGYTALLASGTILATGTLNYLAVSES